MMAGWRDFAARTNPEPDACANSAINAVSPPIGTNGTNGTAPPSSVAAALAQLEGMACPLSCEPRAWGRMVADARKLVREGWALKALDLGWSEVDLFGIAEDQNGSPGLAAWLGGDEVTVILDSCAAVRLLDGGRRYFNRPVTGAVLPWKGSDDDGA